MSALALVATPAVSLTQALVPPPAVVLVLVLVSALVALVLVSALVLANPLLERGCALLAFIKTLPFLERLFLDYFENYA